MLNKQVESFSENAILYYYKISVLLELVGKRIEQEYESWIEFKHDDFVYIKDNAGILVQKNEEKVFFQANNLKVISYKKGKWERFLLNGFDEFLKSEYRKKQIEEYKFKIKLIKENFSWGD